MGYNRGIRKKIPKRDPKGDPKEGSKRGSKKNTKSLIMVQKKENHVNNHDFKIFEFMDRNMSRLVT